MLLAVGVTAVLGLVAVTIRSSGDDDTAVAPTDSVFAVSSEPGEPTTPGQTAPEFASPVSVRSDPTMPVTAPPTAAPSTSPTSAVPATEAPASPVTESSVEPVIESTAPSIAPPTAPTTSIETAVPATVQEVAPADTADSRVLPDGSPVPIEAVYDGPLVTLTGFVPSQAASQRFEALAIAGSPTRDTVADNRLEIDENVPINVGARVTSLDSVRFPTGSAEITPAHAAELDGTVGTLQALPNASLLVIGHADQRGDDLTNLILSEERAASMVRYLIAQGIDPSRLSSRAMGEQNPISEENSAAALELNRRTELIFYGLLVE